MVKRILMVVLVLAVICSASFGGLLSAVGLSVDEAQAATEDFETGDFTKFPWITGGDAAWSIATDSAHSGSNAAKATAVTSTLETTVNIDDPGDISFWYRVSTEDGFDFLEFYVDGEKMGEWSGDSGWLQSPSYQVGTTGSHTFKWVYQKDPNGADFEDSVWVDDIVFPGDPIVPTYTVNATVIGGNGSITCLPAVITHGDNMVCTIEPALGYRLATFTDNMVDQRFAVSADKYTVGAVSGNHTIVGKFVVNNAVEDFETQDLTKFPWVTGAKNSLSAEPVAASWTVTPDGYNGSFSAEAPESLADNQTSYLETTLYIPTPGNVSFKYRVSSETVGDVGDFLRFYIDGIQQPNESTGFGWAGEIPWAAASYPIPLAGVHTFRWEYGKDGADSSTLDRAWIDEVVFPGAVFKLSYAINASVIGGNGTVACDSSVIHGNNTVCTVSPAVGYRLGSFTDNTADKIDAVSGNSYTLTNVAVDHTITATFVTSSDYEDFETGDLTKFPWKAGATTVKPWSVTANGRGAPGTFAAEAPRTGDNDLGNDESSVLETTLNIPASGNITFWYRVSSEAGDGNGNGDFLRFFIDSTEIGSELGSWSGDTDWAQATFPVTAGDHTFRWEYVKDGSVDAGADTAWIDDIIFPGATYKPAYNIDTPPVIFGGSISCVSPVPHGADSLCTVTPTAGYKLASFTDNGIDKFILVSEVNSYTITNALSDHTITGTFVSNANIEDFETGDLTKFPWNSAGWSITDINRHTGRYAAKAPVVADGGASSIETTMFVPAASEMSFWYQVSSETGLDFLKFYVNGVEAGSWSGVMTDWALVTYNLESAGFYTFRWEYSKDLSNLDGADTAWIDDIVIPGATLTSPPFKLLRSGSPDVYLPTLLDAYNSAISDDIIMIKADAPFESLTADKDVIVTINGGYNDLYADIIGNSILGTTTIKAGTVRANNIKTK